MVMRIAVFIPAHTSTPNQTCEALRFHASKGADTDSADEGGRTPISTADVYPLAQVSMALYELSVAEGRKPIIMPTKLC